jgi:transcriptional regulator with XRE-family HTH domain
VQYITNDVKTILDKIKEIYLLKTDTELAKKLGVTKSFMSRLRAGERAFSPTKMREVEALLYAQQIITCSYLDSSFELSTFDLGPVNSKKRKKIIEAVAGKCQLCRCDAPFKDNNGTPYLIVKSLQKYDIDKRQDLVALCPNCSARLRVLKDKNDIKLLKTQ